MREGDEKGTKRMRGGGMWKKGKCKWMERRVSINNLKGNMEM